MKKRAKSKNKKDKKAMKKRAKGKKKK